MKPTPGSWKVIGNRWAQGILIGPRRGQIVAIIPYRTKTDLNGRAAANARLVAAAPSLLDAVRIALYCLTEVTAIELSKEEKQAVESLRQAILKAEGEQ